MPQSPAAHLSGSESNSTDPEAIPLETLNARSSMERLVDADELGSKNAQSEPNLQSQTEHGDAHIQESQHSSFDLEIRNFQYSQLPKWKRILIAIWKGPEEVRDEPPQRFNTPVLLFVEGAAEKYRRIVPRWAKITSLTIYLILWYALLHSILSPFFTTSPSISDHKDIPVLSLGCTDQLWRGKNGACGLDAKFCIPEDEEVYFRCPALCDRSWTYSLVPIGDQRVKYRGYFVGGGEHKKGEGLSHPYRADSYVCGSAVHAGIVSPFYGGCGKLSYSSGSQSHFKSTKGHYGVDDSLEFNSFFPFSYYFKSAGALTNCYDPRLPILVMNIVLGIPVVFLASGEVLFWVVNTVGFWTIVLATDPPVQIDATDPETTASLISIGLERFLPSCFILYVLWTISSKRTLTAPEGYKTSYLKRVFLFYPFFWLGVLNNISFDRLPVDRFTLNDLKTQPGGAVAVSGIVTLVVVCAIIQAYKIWQAGKFKKYLLIYILFILGLVLIGLIPGLTLRVHHYILAMLLIPGCSTRGSTALMFQGILLGLFLSGAAKWGLAAVAETDTSLRRDDPSGAILPPIITDYDPETGILSWTDEHVSPVFTGISILINDIERYVSENITSVSLKQLFHNSSELSHMAESSLKDHKHIPLYIRIGKKIIGTKKYSDYSNAAVVHWPDGDIDLPKPGIT